MPPQPSLERDHTIRGEVREPLGSSGRPETECIPRNRLYDQPVYADPIRGGIIAAPDEVREEEVMACVIAKSPDDVTDAPAREVLAGELFDWIADGRLEIMVGDRIPLSEARRAHEAIQGRATTGKVLLVP